MPISDATPTIVAARLLRFLGDNAIYAARVNRQWTAEARVGNVVKILPPGSVSVADYDPAGNAVLTYPEYEPGAGLDVLLDQVKSWSIKVEDVHERQSVPNLLASGVEIAGRELVKTIDEHVRDTMHGASTSNRDIGTNADGSRIDFDDALGEDSVLAFKQAFRAAVRKMDDANIPRAGRWAIVGPVAVSALTEIFESGQLGDATLEDTVRNGFMGRLYGLQLYASSNPKTEAAGAANKFEQIMFGNDYGLAHISQMDNTERLRLESRHADAVRGLAVYGSKFIETDGFFEATIHYVNLPDFS